MEVQLDAIARGDDYNTKVFYLIEYLEASGRLGLLIKCIVNQKQNSPYLTSVKNEFAKILDSQVHEKLYGN
jgi:prophage DNA circulation protein